MNSLNFIYVKEKIKIILRIKNIAFLAVYVILIVVF